MSMTQSQIQVAIASEYDGEAVAPSSTSDDWLLRQSISNEALRVWERDRWWKELQKTDSSNTLTAGDYTYNCPSDFRNITGWVYSKNASSGKTFYTHVNKAETPRMSSTSPYYYITGDPNAGYVVNINSGLTLTTGDTLYIDYVKKATLYTATTTVSEIQDPQFIVFYVLWKLYEQDGDTVKANNMRQEALTRLSGMRAEDDLMGYDQPNRVEDSDFALGYGGFGV